MKEKERVVVIAGEHRGKGGIVEGMLWSANMAIVKTEDGNEITVALSEIVSTNKCSEELRLDLQIEMLKEKANRPDASDEDVKKLLKTCNYDVDLAVSLILNEDISAK